MEVYDWNDFVRYWKRSKKIKEVAMNGSIYIYADEYKVNGRGILLYRDHKLVGKVRDFVDVIGIDLYEGEKQWKMNIIRMNMQYFYSGTWRIYA